LTPPYSSNVSLNTYNEVMAAELPVAYDDLEHSGSRLTQAHAYFSGVIGEWVEAGGEDAVESRCQQLTHVLTDGMQLVVIQLRTDEDSQEIFETLNARGTPLTAADLIKNFVFQRLALERAQAEKAYQDHWQLFETKFWEVEVSAGRYLTPRSSLFLNQWLIAQTGEEVSPRATFSRFKHYVEHEMTMPMADLLPTLHRQASEYQRWVQRAADPHAQLTTVEMFVYRTQALDSEIVKPILLWLHHPQQSPIPGSAVAQVLAAVESWLVRRTLVRQPSADHGRIVADLIASHRGVDPEHLGPNVTAYLAGQDRASTYWPGDDELRKTLQELPAYKRYKRGRLRMVLEAVEDHARSFTKPGSSPAGVRVQRGVLHIEHLLPQKWQTNWPVDGLEAEVIRQDHVHVLGNLTLLTGSLNSKVSNGPWLGADGKRAQLDAHDVFLMNRQIQRMSENGWDEMLIDTRTSNLIDAILETWPVPEGHEGNLRDDSANETVWIELKHLVQAGMLSVGTVLTAPSGKDHEVGGVVLPGGRIEVDGKVFGSPSGAARQVRGRAANGWTFWRVPDGRRLEDLRTVFRQGSSGD
jgi:Protein of unknown function (DUF1524)/Restriction Enzyme Adenine Methylase Associated/Protein of unknown function DUF262